MGYRNISSVVVFAGGICFVAAPAAQADNYCYQKNSCGWQEMKIVNQNDPLLGSPWILPERGTSMLCGPASATMVIHAVANAARPEDVKSDKIKRYLGASTPDEMRSLVISAANEIMYSPEKGSIFIPDYLPDWLQHSLEDMLGFFGLRSVNDLVPNAATRGGIDGSYGSASAWGPPVTVGYFIKHLRDNPGKRRADMFNYGHYVEKKKRILGTDWYWYKRQGGHFVAVNGYVNADDPNNRRIVIYNPWWAVREERTIQKKEGGSTWKKWHGIPYKLEKVVVLPGLSGESSYLYQTDDKIKIIDGVMGTGVGL
ncbi:MAG: hypothetical protein A2583_13110 [Bdellovibrionales bacterium RIFOXYD1_FULL_53_11]|nr:MAG: hypothetical protein A2583_13110 [Bdellovibrionales bacterium RIFOXYD1_FULL_53_11]